MGIRAKQLLTSTFTSTEVGRLFDTGAIAGSKLASGGVSETQIASTSLGDGLSGAGGSKITSDVSTAVGAQQYGGLVKTSTSDGSGAASANAGYLAVQTDNATLEIDASNQVQIKTQGVSSTELGTVVTSGAGLTGGAGSALAVDQTGATVSVTAGTWTYTKDTLQVTGTPDSANDPVNKAALDNAVAGLLWKDPAATVRLLGNVDATGLIGNATIATLNGLTPSTGDAYIATDAGTPTAGTSDALVAGSLTQYDGAQWKEIVAGSGGFVPVGTYCLLSTATALISPYTDATHDGYRVRFNGSDNDPTDQGSADFFSPNAGDAYVVDGSGAINEGGLIEFSGSAFVTLETPSGGFVPAGVRAMLGAVPGTAVLISPYTDATDDGKIVDFSGSSNTGANTGDTVDKASLLIQDTGHVGYNDNNAYVYEGTVPTGSWIQWNGGGQLNAGAGLTKDGNTLNVGQGVGITVNADDVAVAPSKLISGGDAEIDGDLLDVNGLTYNNVTPTFATTGSQASTATTVDQLAAHLLGIDNALSAINTAILTSSDKGVASATTVNDEDTTGVAITTTPLGWVGIHVNGILYPLGDGVKTAACYFSADGGTTPRSISAIVATDVLYWVQSVAGFNLDTSDIIDLVYET
jgi:hypothetical protein